MPRGKEVEVRNILVPLSKFIEEYLIEELHNIFLHIVILKLYYSIGTESPLM